MVTGESLYMFFDLIMTRFEVNYSPHITYDASCLSKEYGYNRELRRVMMLRITTDCFHQCTHSTSLNMKERVKERNKPSSPSFIGFLLAAVLFGTAVVPLSDSDLVFLLVPPS